MDDGAKFIRFNTKDGSMFVRVDRIAAFGDATAEGRAGFAARGTDNTAAGKSVVVIGDDGWIITETTDSVNEIAEVLSSI